MKSVYILFLFGILLFFSSSLKAQSGELEVSYRQNQDNSVDFSYDKTMFGTYFVSVQFQQINNCDQNYYKGSVMGLSGRMFSLKPKNAENGIGFSYSYRYVRGKPNPKIKEDFVYQLPFKKGTKIKVQNLGYLGKFVGQGSPDSWRAYQFISEESVPVLASRKGLVVKVVDHFVTDTTKDYRFKDSMNEVIIEHRDGTFARYSGFKSGSITVSEGQSVTPYTELGKTGRYDEEKKYLIHFYINYLNTRDIDLLTTDEKMMHAYSYITPLFFFKGGKAILLTGNDYVVDWLDEYIVQEFSRREKKKYVSPL